MQKLYKIFLNLLKLKKLDYEVNDKSPNDEFPSVVLNSNDIPKVIELITKLGFIPERSSSSKSPTLGYYDSKQHSTSIYLYYSNASNNLTISFDLPEN